MARWGSHMARRKAERKIAKSDKKDKRNPIRPAKKKATVKKKAKKKAKIKVKAKTKRKAAKKKAAKKRGKTARPSDIRHPKKKKKRRSRAGDAARRKLKKRRHFTIPAKHRMAILRARYPDIIPQSWVPRPKIVTGEYTESDFARMTTQIVQRIEEKIVEPGWKKGSVEALLLEKLIASEQSGTLNEAYYELAGEYEGYETPQDVYKLWMNTP